MNASPAFRTPMTTNPPTTFAYIPKASYETQNFNGIKIASPSSISWTASETSSKQKRNSKRHSTHRSKSSKHHSKRRIGAYLLQIIGLICLVMAAVKSFEPLTGAGITLVLVGYRELDNSSAPGSFT